MTDPNYTHIAMVIDRSGSMSSVVESTIAGFNEFIQGQRALPGKIRVDVAQFDHEYTRWLTDVPVAEVPALSRENYKPRGNTALLDAVALMVNELGATLAAKPENERPSKVIVVIQTDGQENASKDYTREKLFALIQQQEKVYSWDFLFIGADRDAFQQAASIGIAAGSTFKYASTHIGTRSMYGTLSNAVANAHVTKAKASFQVQDQDSDPLKGEDRALIDAARGYTS